MTIIHPERCMRTQWNKIINFTGYISWAFILLAQKLLFQLPSIMHLLLVSFIELAAYVSIIISTIHHVNSACLWCSPCLRIMMGTRCLFEGNGPVTILNEWWVICCEFQRKDKILLIIFYENVFVYNDNIYCTQSWEHSFQPHEFNFEHFMHQLIAWLSFVSIPAGELSAMWNGRLKNRQSSRKPRLTVDSKSSHETTAHMSWCRMLCCHDSS